MAGWTLPGRTVLITGGAGGIGAATALELTRRGATCALADLDPEGLARTAAEIGGDPLTIELDITDPEACERAVEATVERHGGLDAVWANAGIASFGPVMRTDPDAWKRTIDVNLAGSFNTVRAALPSIVARRGYVAVTASVASFAAPPAMSAYSASKAGVEALFNGLRLEVAHLGVDVGTIHPTWIATAMVEEGDTQMDAFAVLRKTLSFPLNRTYPVEKAARQIARGFERRSRRVGVPGWVRALHGLRSLTTTRVFERDLRGAAPEIDRLFGEQVAERGAEGASTSDRVRDQVPSSTT